LKSVFQKNEYPFITFCVRRSRGEMYSGHGRVCVYVCLCVCLSLATFPHYCADPDVIWRHRCMFITVNRGRGRGCPLVVHYWTDSQSMHVFSLIGRQTRNVSECLYSFYAWFYPRSWPRTCWLTTSAAVLESPMPVHCGHSGERFDA